MIRARIGCLVVIGACGGSPIGGDDGGPRDAAPVVVDAAVDAGSAAVDAGSAAVDAAPAAPDAPGDAPADAGLRPVTMHALGRSSDTGPPAGIAVLFYGPGGELTGRRTTNALGVATGIVPEGGSVTVVEEAAHKLTTIAAVVGGDELLVGDVGTWNPPIRYTALAVPPGPDSDDIYILRGTCASGLGASPVTTTMWACAPASGPILATAFQIDPFGQWGALRGYLYSPQVPLQDGGTATLTGTWLPPIVFDVDITVPSSVQRGVFNVHRVIGGHALVVSQSGTIETPGGAFTRQLLLPGGGDGGVTELRLDYQSETSGENVILEYRLARPRRSPAICRAT